MLGLVYFLVVVLGCYLLLILEAPVWVSGQMYTEVAVVARDLLPLVSEAQV